MNFTSETSFKSIIITYNTVVATLDFNEANEKKADSYATYQNRVNQMTTTNDWHTIYITDCTGKKFFNTQASPMSTASEIKNISRHLDGIKSGSKAYDKVGVDKASAKLMLDGSPYMSIDEICDDDLLNELFGE